MMQENFATETSRLEAFSDGVIAVIITIMVLDLRPPHGASLHAILPMASQLATYVLSFIFVGIYWNNHHHMLRASQGIDGRAMWANLHLLFWLSLVPFITSWLGQNPRASVPTALYGCGLLMEAIAYTVLQNVLIGINGKDGALAKAISSDLKGKVSILLYALAISLAFVSTYISDVLYIAVAVMWIIPDRRLEPVIDQKAHDSSTVLS